jgi:membrane peptidoglycan carboxypeptidase
VLDHANGMATFAAGGKRAQAHFVKSVTRRGQQVYTEKLSSTDLGLDQEQINELNWTLRQVEAAKLDNGWDVAGKTGTWQAGNSVTENAHTWMVGYTRALAAAVWLGTTDGKALTTSTGSNEVYGANYAAPIWRQFMVAATAALKLDKDKYRFGAPKFPNETPSPKVVPTQPTRPATPSRPPTVAPSRTNPAPKPSCPPGRCPGPSPTPSRPPAPASAAPAQGAAPGVP